MSLLAIPTWSPSSMPTHTVLSSINPTHTSGLQHTLSSVISRASTETDPVNLMSLSQMGRGAQASLTIIGAEQVLATATADAVKARATQAIFEATVNLNELSDEENLYNTNLKMAPNVVYLVIFAIVFFFTTGMLVTSRYHWYNITFFAGYGLEFAGFLGRSLAIHKTNDINLFLLQYITLTIAPAFIMGGIYFIFAQVVVIHGREFSVLKPMWYSYFFIATDVVSLLIQAGGGGAASIASKNHTDPAPGTNTMIAGISFQVVAMTIFLGFWFEFLNRIYFKHAKTIAQTTSNPLAKRSFGNYLKFLFNTKKARAYRREHLDAYYNPKFADIRSRSYFDWFPLAVTVAVIAIYIRCVYRVAELSEGFDGYLVTTEVFLMVLDALMIAICGLIFIPFHPVLVFGSKNVIKLETIKKNHDIVDDEKKVDYVSDQVSDEFTA